MSELGGYVAPAPSFLTATKTLTSAQILALHGTPVIDVIPGVPGKVIVPLIVSLNYIFGTVTYFAGAGQQVEIYYHGNQANGAVYTQPWADTITQLANAFETIANVQAPHGLSSLFIGQGLDIGGGAPEVTLGDGTLKITIQYLLLDGVV